MLFRKSSKEIEYYFKPVNLDKIPNRTNEEINYWRLSALED